MRPEFFIAKRYLFARKSHNVINIISVISVIGVMVGAMGLIIVLSVFNGFSGLVISLYNSFDPDIKISAVQGKTFDPTSLAVDKIKSMPEVAFVSFSVEEGALVKYRDRQFIVTIKGVDQNFDSITGISSKVVEGKYLLKDTRSDYAVVGGGIAYGLSLSLEDMFNPLTIYVPKKGKPVSMVTPEDAFSIELIRPSGIFTIQQDFDSKYVLIPLEMAKELIGSANKISAVEIGLKPGSDEEAVNAKISAAAGKQFKSETRLQQHQFLYRILKSEKWAVYFILSFILMIAVFNIVGSLTMLIIEKKKDIGVLRALGATEKMIRRIFVVEGLLITMLGAITGLVAGGFICWLQQQFGFIKLENGDSFVVDAYPVSMEAGDFLSVTAIVFLIGFAASFYASSKIKHEGVISTFKQ